ncbi:MAG: hypothetical protein IKI84_10770 [Clostridia bacterium]|nr:hypothetical protein [Clostridia bacterium]
MLRKRIALLLVPVMLLTMILSAPMAGAASIKITSLTTLGTPAVGNTMTWIPNVTGGSGNYEFIYTLYKNTPSGSGYDYLAKTPGSYSFKFTETGTYYLQVVAQDTKYNYVSSAYVSSAIVVVGTGPRIGSVVPNATYVQIGSTVQWTVYGETGGVGASGITGSVTYEYSLYRKSDDLVINTLRSNPIFAYTLNEPGDYRLCVRGTDEVGTSAWYDTGYLVSAYAPPLVMESLTVSSALIELGETVTIKATTHGGYQKLHYYWKVYSGASVIDSFESDTPSVTYKPTATGIYHFSCEVYDQSSQSTGEVTTVDVTVTSPVPFDITSITRSATKVQSGNTISWKINLVGGQGTKTVIYTILKNGSAFYTNSVTTTGSSVTVTYFADETGLYTIRAFAIDSNATYTLTNPYTLADPIVVYDASSLYLADLVGSPSRMYTGGTITWTWSHYNNKGGLKTTYTIYRNGTPVKTVSGFSGYIVKYTVPTGAFGIYSISITSEDQVTHQTCSISGGLVDYSYSGALTFTSVVPVNASLDAPGYGEWLFTLGGDPMGKVEFTYNIVGAVTGSVASGSLSATVTGNTVSSSVKVFLPQGDTYTITLTAVDDTPRAAATYTGAPVTVAGGSTTSMTIVNLHAISSEVTSGSPITWTFGVKGVTGTWSAAYKVMFTPAGSSTTIAVATGTVTSPSITRTFTGVGRYYVEVQGTDSVGTTGWYTSDTVKMVPASNTALSVSVPSPNTTACMVGNTITWTFSVSGAIGNYMVFYAIYQADKIMKMSSAADDSPISYVPNNPGYYSLKVYAMDSTGTKCDPKQSTDTQVSQSAVVISGLVISVPTVSTNKIFSPQLVTWSYIVSSQTEDYIINYKVYKVDKAGNTTLVIDNVTHKHSFSVYLDETGNYYATVQAQLTDGSGIVSQIEQSEYVVCNLPEELIEVVTPAFEPAFDPEITLPDAPVVPSIPEIEED